MFVISIKSKYECDREDFFRTPLANKKTTWIQREQKERNLASWVAKPGSRTEQAGSGWNSYIPWRFRKLSQKRRNQRVHHDTIRNIRWAQSRRGCNLRYTQSAVILQRNKTPREWICRGFRYQRGTIFQLGICLIP